MRVAMAMRCTALPLRVPAAVPAAPIRAVTAEDREGGAVDMAPDGRPRADVSSDRPGSHWPNVFLMLPEPTPVRAGDVIYVTTKARLGDDHPRYDFEVKLGSRLLGKVAYPE